MVGEHSRFTVAIGIDVAVFAFLFLKCFLRANKLSGQQETAKHEKMFHEIVFIAA